MPEKDYIISVNIGATKIRIGKVRFKKAKGGRVEVEIKKLLDMRLSHFHSSDEIDDKVIDVFYSENSKPHIMSTCCPGVVDEDKRKIKFVSFLEHVPNFPSRLLREGNLVTLINDLSAEAYATGYFGPGYDCDSFVLLNIGSGLNYSQGFFVKEGKSRKLLVPNRTEFGVEPWTCPFQFEYDLNIGTRESYCSGKAIEQMIQKAIKEDTDSDLSFLENTLYRLRSHEKDARLEDKEFISTISLNELHDSNEVQKRLEVYANAEDLWMSYLMNPNLRPQSVLIPQVAEAIAYQIGAVNLATRGSNRIFGKGYVVDDVNDPNNKSNSLIRMALGLLESNQEKYMTIPSSVERPTQFTELTELKNAGLSGSAVHTVLHYNLGFGF